MPECSAETRCKPTCGRSPFSLSEKLRTASLFSFLLLLPRSHDKLQLQPERNCKFKLDAAPSPLRQLQGPRIATGCHGAVPAAPIDPPPNASHPSSASFPSKPTSLALATVCMVLVTGLGMGLLGVRLIAVNNGSEIGKIGDLGERGGVLSGAV